MEHGGHLQQIRGRTRAGFTNHLHGHGTWCRQHHCPHEHIVCPEDGKGKGSFHKNRVRFLATKLASIPWSTPPLLHFFGFQIADDGGVELWTLLILLTVNQIFDVF